MSPKQSILWNAFFDADTLTLRQCVDLVGGDIYCNQSFYVGQILKRMVDNGWIERVSRGVYRIKGGKPQKDAKSGAVIKCAGSTAAVMPAMEDWARERGLID